MVDRYLTLPCRGDGLTAYPARIRMLIDNLLGGCIVGGRSRGATGSRYDRVSIAFRSSGW